MASLESLHEQAKIGPAHRSGGMRPEQRPPLFLHLVGARHARLPDPAPPPAMQPESWACWLAAGVTCVLRLPGIAYHLRTSPSSGALFPVEAFLERPAELAHYDPERHAWEVVPEPSASAGRLWIAAVLSRTGWKYGDRAYRYVLWDAGHALYNAAAGLAALGIPFRIRTDFDDVAAARMLHLDPPEMAPLVAVEWNAAGLPPPAPGAAWPEGRSHWERSHAATACGSSDILWPVPLREPPAAIHDRLRARRSPESFAPRPLPFADVARAMASIRVPPPIRAIVALERVEDARPGLYVWQGSGDLAPLREGRFGHALAQILLEQDIVAEAAATIIWTADSLWNPAAPRTYRATHLAAGWAAMAAHHAANRLGWCARSIGAWFDDALDEFLGLRPPAAGALITLWGHGA